MPQEERCRWSRFLHHFCQISPFHGCSYIANRASLAELLAWLFLITVSVYFCVNETVILIGVYRSQATTISVTRLTPDSINLSDLGICFETTRWDLRYELLACDTTYNESLAALSALIRKAAPKKFDLSMLNPTYQVWDCVMKNLYMALGEVIELDLGAKNWVVHIDDIRKEKAQQTRAFFTAHGYTLPELVDQTARFICRQVPKYYSISEVPEQTCTPASPLKLETSYKDNPDCIDLCGLARVSWFGLSTTELREVICFGWKGSELEKVAPIFTRSDQALILSAQVSRTSTTIADTYCKNPNHEYSGRLTAFIDLQSPNALIDWKKRENRIPLKDCIRTYVGIQVVSRFKALNRSMAPCGEGITPKLVLECLGNRRLAKEGCWPLAARNEAPKGVTFCSRRHTEQEEKASQWEFANKTRVTEFEHCMNETSNLTLPACETTTYDYQTYERDQREWVKDPENECSTQAYIYQRGFDYPLLEERLSMDFSAFLAAFGGVIGLWLGGSLIALVHIPIYVILSSLQSRKEPDKQISVATGTAELIIKRNRSDLNIPIKQPKILNVSVSLSSSSEASLTSADTLKHRLTPQPSAQDKESFIAPKITSEVYHKSSSAVETTEEDRSRLATEKWRQEEAKNSVERALQKCGHQHSQ